MAKIYLDKRYRIESTSTSWNLIYREEKFNKRLGKPTTSKRTTYHATLEQALMGYCDKEFRDCDTGKELLEKLTQLRNDIQKRAEQIQFKINQVE
jgi:hypothetical protein